MAVGTALAVVVVAALAPAARGVDRSEFPPGFLFGAATSAYQVSERPRRWLSLGSQRLSSLSHPLAVSPRASPCLKAGEAVASVSSCLPDKCSPSSVLPPPPLPDRGRVPGGRQGPQQLGRLHPHAL